MVDLETHVNGHSRQPGPVSGFASGAAHVLGDVLELAELQAKLARADAVKAFNSSMLPAFMLVLGGCTAVAALPVIILGLANLLTVYSPLNVWQSQLATGAVVGIVAALIVYAALRSLRRAGLQFQRSLRELANNVAWAKAAIRSHQSPMNQRNV